MWERYFPSWYWATIYLISAGYFSGMTLVLVALSIAVLYSLPNSHWKLHLAFSILTALWSATATLVGKISTRCSFPAH